MGNMRLVNPRTLFKTHSGKYHATGRSKAVTPSGLRFREKRHTMAWAFNLKYFCEIN